MTTQEILRLNAACKRISASSRGLGIMGRISQWANKEAQEREVLNSPGFACDMAMWLSLNNLTTPLLEKPPYLWLRKMAEFLQPGCTMTCHDLEAQADFEALPLRHSMHEPLLRAALLATDATAENVAAALGLDALVVACYSTLFYDVLDRKDDAAYRQIAMKSAMMPRGYVYAVQHLNPSMAALLVAGLCGTVADVMEMAKGVDWASAA